MWQQNQKNKTTHSRRGSKKSKPSNQLIHFRRVRAQIKLLDTDQVIHFEGRVVLNDLKPDALMIYLTEFIEPGYEIAISLEEPKGLYLKGSIIRIDDFNQGSKVLSNNPYSYRIQVGLNFEDEEERSRVQSIYERVQREVLYPEKFPGFTDERDGLPTKKAA